MKWLYVLLVVFLLAACSEEETIVSKSETVTAEATQEELNEQLKEEATQANIVELNSDEAEMNKKVFAEGEVTVITEPDPLGTFTLTTEEENGLGMYAIKNLSGVEVTEGELVKVYGTFSGPDEVSMPSITVTIIEKQ